MTVPAVLRLIAANLTGDRRLERGEERFRQAGDGLTVRRRRKLVRRQMAEMTDGGPAVQRARQSEMRRDDGSQNPIPTRQAESIGTPLNERGGGTAWIRLPLIRSTAAAKRLMATSCRAVSVTPLTMTKIAPSRYPNCLEIKELRLN